MRNTLKNWLSASTLVALALAVSNPVEAGYGSSGGSGGYGSSGGGGYVSGYGSNGGFGSGGGYGSSGGYGSGGGYGSSGGYGGSSGGASSGGSSGGHVGPVRRLGARIHDHVHAKMAYRSAYRASYGSSGGSSGGMYTNSYGSSGGSHGGYAIRSSGSSGGGSSGGSYYTQSSGGSSGIYTPSYRGGSSGSFGGGSTGSAMQYGSYESSAPTYESYSPSYESYSGPMDGGYGSSSTPSTQAANKLASSSKIQPNEVHLTVNLPESAKVFVNGNPTTTTGSKRHFVSRDLKANDAYRFEVKAVMNQADGTEVVQSKTVVVESGNGEELNFELLKSDDPIETILTLNVPEKASVVLAQNATKSEGSSRVFRTKQLQQGQSWDDYKIQVTHEGVTKEKTIRLIAGDKLELSFNFEDMDSADKVAMN